MPVTIHHNKQKEMYDFLRTHKVGVLATVSKGGEPDAAAIYFTVDHDLHVSFLTKTGTRKAHNLQHGKHAALVVYDAGTQTTVQLRGEASQITDSAKANALFTEIIYTSLDTSGVDVPPISKLDEGDYVAYRLRPTEVRMAVFSHPKTGGYHQLFKTVEH